MGVVDVKDRIAAVLARKLVHVELKRRLALFADEDKSHSVSTDRGEHVAHQNRVARALAHLVGLPVFEQIYHLH